MNRSPRYRSLLIIALGCLTGSLALSQEEFASSELAACMIDISVHCGSAQPGGGRIIRCLQEKRGEITPECRIAVTPTDFQDGTEGLKLNVTIDRLKSQQGVLIVMLSDDADKFPLSPKRTAITPIGTRNVSVAFQRLKPGTYAVSVIHDLDENGKFESGEGFAASNGVSGQPNFAASAIKIEKNASIAISMRYP